LYRQNRVSREKIRKESPGAKSAPWLASHFDSEDKLGS